MGRWLSKPKNTHAGDRRAIFEKLVHEHARAIYGSALRMARNADDAQDLTQDALIRAYSAFHSFALDTNFRAWILRILTNLYISKYWRAAKLEDHEFSDPESCAHYTSTPEIELLERVLDEEIELALNRLGDGLRLAVLLVDAESLTYEEAAAAMDIPVGTVRSRLNRGRMLLRQYLADYARERLRIPAQRSAK